jgi:hypothetical protein
MNLIRDLINDRQSEKSALLSPDPFFSLRRVKSVNLKAVKSISMLLIIISITLSFFMLSAKKNEVEALPFGLNNNYLEIAATNKKFSSIVPVPIETIQTSQEKGDKRVVALLAVLNRYGSPMANVSVARAFISSAEKYGFGDKWFLLPAIAGIESGFGRIIPYHGSKSSFNAWGWGGPGAWVYFKSWEDAIDRISRGLAKGYGLQNLTPERMMATYCPPCAKELDTCTVL